MTTDPEAFVDGLTVGAGAVLLTTTTTWSLTPALGLPPVATPIATWSTAVGVFIVGAILKRGDESIAD